MKAILAGLLNVPLEAVLLLSAPYSSLDLRNVTKSAAKVVLKKDYPKLLERIVWLIGEHKAISQVRNDISHNVWQRGDAPNSIRPMQADVRSGTFKLFGGDEDSSREYTHNDLTNLHNKARAVVEGFYEVMHGPEFTEFIADNMALAKALKAAREGSSDTTPSFAPDATPNSKAR